MIRLIAFAAFALAVTTSAQAMPVAPIQEPEGMITQVVADADRAGHELVVSAWPEPPNAMSAEKSAGVHDGVEALACATIETPPNRTRRKEPAFKRLPSRKIFAESKNAGRASTPHRPPGFNSRAAPRRRHCPPP